MAIESFVLAVATSTVCATLINQGVTQWREHRAKKENGRLSALYLAELLERYCGACSTYLADKEAHTNSQGHAGNDWGCLPTIPEYPDDIDWKALGIPFTERVFRFRVDVEAIQGMISDAYSFDPPEGGDGHVLDNLPAKGLEANLIAQDLRRSFRLKPQPTDREWSSERHLRESRDARQERIRRWRTENEQRRADKSATLL